VDVTEVRSHTRSVIAVARRRSSRGRGFTLLELIIVLIVLAILASAAIPLVRNGVVREREVALREALRELRGAVDDYKRFVETRPDLLKIQEKRTESGYPPTLQVLVEGIELNTPGAEEKKRKFLRKIPVDPMTGSAEWGLRGYTDTPTSTSWNGEDVFDVYSKSDKVALDGTKYKDW
jgi:general secretion pathway protein G